MVNATDFGVPQRRRRLIMLAMRGLKSKLPDTLVSEEPLAPVTVSDAFLFLSKNRRAADPLDVGRTLSRLALKRVQAIPEGGNRFDLPEHLQLACHMKVDKRGRSATSSYGRMRWGQPSPTMTTRCTTIACGSFIHPSEHRGITLREAATLQTFPLSYDFAGNYGAIERQIGNAVPVTMADRLGSLVQSL